MHSPTPSPGGRRERWSSKLCEHVHVAFLRGINVGGKHSLAMTALAAQFTESGCADVRTWIQSGNVLFSAAPPLARRIPTLVAAGISKRFGFEAPVVTCTAAELAAIVKNNPFLRDAPDPKFLHVVFLADPPDRSRAALLDPDRSPPDRFALRGSEIYLLCPNGVGKSRLTAQYFDSTLKTASTFRNWNTVLKMLELSRLPPRSG